MGVYGASDGGRRRREPRDGEPPSIRGASDGWAPQQRPRPARSSVAPSGAVPVRPLRSMPRATPARRAPRRAARTAPRRAARPLEVPEHHTTWLKAGLASLAALVLLAVCGLGSWQILRDERAGTSAHAQEPTPTAIPRDISTRAADPAPLTVAEVFPAKEIVIAENQPTYALLGTQAQKDCKAAIDGKLTALLGGAGCSQVVRGTLRSPTKDYYLTGGIFNLASTADAKRAYDQTKTLIDARHGRFKGYVPSAATKVLALASTHLGWDYRGHYLVYCVIARVDGKDFAEGDPFAQQILYDVIEVHLLGKVVQNRAVVAVSPQASASRSGLSAS